MRWKTKPHPCTGDMRTRVRFAWFPVTSSDGTTRWLERVRVVQLYQLSWGGLEWFTLYVEPVS